MTRHFRRNRPGSRRATTLARRLILAGLAGSLGFCAFGVPAADAATSATLGSGATLAACQSISAGSYRLYMQCDGNLVEYGPSGVVWSSRTNASGNANAYLTMQTDGNLVIYRPGGTPIFSTGTNVNAGGGSVLVLQDDGNAVLYAAGHTARWATKSPAEAAITWYYGHVGSTTYDVPSHRCELAAENSFGTSGKYASAIANWNARNHHSPYTSAPRGTLVFYNTSALGHVAISLGNGKVMSSSSQGSPGAIGTSAITTWAGLGWDYSPWGTPW